MDEQQQRLAEELLFSEKKKPSFAKMLYFGVFDSSQVFPFPQASSEERQRADVLLQKLDAFMQKNLDPVAIDRGASIPDAVIRGLGELGILGMNVPKEFGGIEMSQHSYCRAVEAIAARCGSTALLVNAHQSIGLKALLLFGTEAQQRKWLPSMATGKSIAAFALTEPNAGSDASGVESRAVYDPERKIYRINGRKQWITNGSIANVLTVMAQTEVDTPKGKQDKITAFLVTPDMPGFHVIDPSLEKVGMRGTKTAILEFRNLEVPEENILGPLGAGLRICLTVLDYGRTTFGAMCTGGAKELVRRATQHAITRHQFKRPLATFGLVKKKIATMAALTYAMEATTFLTGGFVDSKTEDFMLESAMLKVFASDSLWTILYDAMQILGGRSFFTDEPYERMMRDARLNMIGEGSNEVMRAFIGVVGMRDVGMQLKGVSEAFLSPISQFDTLKRFGQSTIKRLSTPQVAVRSPLLQKEAVALGKGVRRFGFAITRLLATYRENILEKQLILDRIATSAMALYTTTAVLSKLDSDLLKAQGSIQALGNDVAIARLYCKMAMSNLDSALSGIGDSIDDQIESVSDQITGVRYP